MNPIVFLCGKRFVFSADDTWAVLNLCLRQQISYSDFTVSEEENIISFSCGFFHAKKLIAACEEQNIFAQYEPLGLGKLFRKYGKRLGIFLGCFIGVALMFLSTRYVWRIDIRGNETVLDSEILSELSDSGFGVGTKISNLTPRVLENKLLEKSDKLSWASVHVTGTVAHVQVIEANAPTEEKDKSPANLVASADGVVSLIELLEGNPVVTIGQAVKAGDLLVSGLFDSQTVGIRYCRADGQVLAKTNHSFSVEIPREAVVSSVVSKKIIGYEISFFGFSKKFFKIGSNRYENCDIIKEEINWDGNLTYPIPIKISLLSAVQTESHTKTLSLEESLEEAYRQLDRRFSECSAKMQLLKKSIQTEITDDKTILYCSYSCIENIAKQVEFEFTES